MIGSLATLLVMFSSLPAAPPVSAGRAEQHDHFEAGFAEFLELQPHTVTIKFATAEDVRLAKVRPLPLYGGADWAVTSRWDDNTWTNLKTREVLLEHGHRGTFFLNDPQSNFYGKDYGNASARSVSDIGRTLASGGTTIGGHSLTHPMMSYQNRNRMLEEVLGCRIVLEAAFDTLVNSYAFSFCNYRSPIEGLVVQRDIATLLARAGYLQVANHRFADDRCWPWGVAGLLPPDGRPIDQAFSGFLADERLQNENPAITYSMHSWYDTPEKWAGFADDLDRYGNRSEWWYCNQNEYGAYRAQYRAATGGSAEPEGTLLRYDFRLPSILDLNDPIPLTFEITGVAPQSVTSIECSGAAIDRAEAPRGTTRFHLRRSLEVCLPVKIDHVASDAREMKASSDYPDIAGQLASDGKTVTLQLNNAGTTPIHIRRVAYRLPLRYGPGVVFRGGRELQPGKQISERLALQVARPESRYLAGDYFFAAQVDLVHNSQPGRVYFTCRASGSHDDRSYPRQGFAVLGPIPRSEFDFDAFDAQAVSETRWTTLDARPLKFEAVDPSIATPLNMEVIPVRGCWDNRGLKPCVYLLRSTVQSQDERRVRLHRDTGTVPATWLNGDPVAATCRLRAGDNHLLLAYEPPVDQSFSPEHAGPMFRISDANSQERLEDIRYLP